jgi:hypothetical protein
MPKVIISDDRQYRYNEAIKTMDELMAPDTIGNARKGREKMSHIERHLDSAGVSLGSFLKDYFEAPDPTGQYKCGCNRIFGSIQALSGHKRSCKV